MSVFKGSSRTPVPRPLTAPMVQKPAWKPGTRPPNTLKGLLIAGALALTVFGIASLQVVQLLKAPKRQPIFRVEGPVWPKPEPQTVPECPRRNSVVVTQIGEVSAFTCGDYAELLAYQDSEGVHVVADDAEVEQLSKAYLGFYAGAQEVCPGRHAPEPLKFERFLGDWHVAINCENGPWVLQSANRAYVGKRETSGLQWELQKILK